MKKLTLILILTLLLMACQNEDSTVDESEAVIEQASYITYDFYTKKPSIISSNYDYAFGLWTGGNDNFSFDLDGRLIDSIEYVKTSDGIMPRAETSFTYDASNNLINIKRRYPVEIQGDNIDYIEEEAYALDDVGNRLEQDQVLERTKATVVDGEVIDQTLFYERINDSGQIVDIALSKDELSDVNIYNNKGLPIKLKRFFPIFTSDNQQATYHVITVRFSYNDYDDVILMETEGYGGRQEYRFEYEYDEHGNWTKRKTMLYGDYKYITERTLTYRE